MHDVDRGPAPGVVDAGEAAVIKQVASVDHFLFGTILMIFALGLYFFFQSNHPSGARGQSRIPSRRPISNLESMDLILMKVIIMVMTVSFLEFILITGMGTLDWSAMVAPSTIISLAASLRWMQSGSGQYVDGVPSAKPKLSETDYLDQLARLATLHA